MRSPPSQSIHASLSHAGHGAAMWNTTRSADRSNRARSVVGQAPDAVHHGRHRVHPVDAMALDQHERALGVEARHHHDVVALEERQRRAREWPVVVERPGDEVHAVRRHPQERRVVGERLPHRPLGRDDELRPPRAPARRRRLERRRDDWRQRLRRHRRLGLEAGGDRRGVPAPPTRPRRRPARDWPAPRWRAAPPPAAARRWAGAWRRASTPRASPRCSRSRSAGRWSRANQRSRRDRGRRGPAGSSAPRAPRA